MYGRANVHSFVRLKSTSRQIEFDNFSCFRMTDTLFEGHSRLRLRFCDGSPAAPRSRRLYQEALVPFPFNRVAKQVSSQQSGGPLGIATPDPSIKIQFPIFVFGVWRPATDRAKAIKEPASDAIWHLGKGNPHLLYMAHRTNIHTYISLRRRKSAPEEQINKIQTFPPSQKGEMQNFTR